jgi:hypothetical protein
MRDNYIAFWSGELTEDPLSLRGSGQAHLWRVMQLVTDIPAKRKSRSKADYPDQIAKISTKNNYFTVFFLAL